jgi:CitB family two-component system response regulator MalR
MVAMINEQYTEKNELFRIINKAANDGNTFEEAMTLGAIDYLVKPFSYERFSIALERFKEKQTVEEGDVVGVMNYETAGRPSMEYSIRK